MREIKREIASAIILSRDGKVLMGRKDPKGGGVYADVWHIPGGGLDSGETLRDALRREVLEETGINIDEEGVSVRQLDLVEEGTAPKTLETGETVLARMRFNRFEVLLPQDAEAVTLRDEGDLHGFRWFSPDELRDAEQIPGGREFFEQMGYIPTDPRP